MDILQLPGGGRDIKEEGGGRAEAMGRERGGKTVRHSYGQIYVPGRADS